MSVKDQKKPNILFILIDDMGWRDLTCYGSTFYETPNLDRFRAEGMMFTDAYAACPVCSPTRASILTGKYPATLQLTNWIAGNASGKLLSAPYLHYLKLEETTLATSLKRAGYKSYHVGKWHLGAEEYWPKKHGFDVNVGGCHYGNPPKGYFSPYGIENLEDGPKGEYLTDRLTNEAISLMNESKSEPFFLYMSYYSVHTPIQAPSELVKKYKKKRKRLGLHKVKELERGEVFPTELKKPIRVKRRLIQSDPTYAAMVERLDWNIGRLLDSLQEMGLKENTFVVFTSDNGGLATAEGSPTCNSPLAEGKGWMYEGGTREPLIIRWPGVVEPHSKSSVPVSSPDFYPTILEAVGLDLMPEKDVEGTSLLPVLTGEGKIPERPLFWHYPHYGNQGGTPGSSIRMGNYKLIEFFEDKSLELYNLVNDLGENQNIIEENPKLAEKMHAILRKWREDVEAKIPQPNPDYTDSILGLKNKLKWLVGEIRAKFGDKRKT